MRARLFFIGTTCAAITLVRFSDPIVLGRWLPVRTSCGALTGLPCLFCGMTRALHLLLHGHFSGALYFNWLVFPFLAAMLFLIALFTVEIARGHWLVNLHALVRLSVRRLAACMLAAIALWTLQVYLALSQHKSELLNSRGSLYSYFVGRR